MLQVVVNQDKTSRIINTLREENMRLQQELMEYKMGQVMRQCDYSVVFYCTPFRECENIVGIRDFWPAGIFLIKV